MNISEKVKLLSQINKLGTRVISFRYEGSDEPVKNVLVGSNRASKAPHYARPVGRFMHQHNAKLFVRGIDNNDHDADHPVKNFNIAKMHAIEGIKAK